MKTNIWNKTYETGGDFIQLSTAEVDFLIGYLNVSDGKRKHLDIGCGTGALNRDFYLRGFQTVGVDTSEEALDIAKKSVDNSFDEISFYANLQDSKDSSFDVITAKYVYRFIDDRESFLVNISNKLKDDGTFVIIDPLIESLPEQKRAIVLSESTVLGELSKSFTVDVKKYRKNTYYFCKKQG